MTERYYNKLVLLYLADLRGIPQTASEIADYVAGRVNRPAQAETLRALDTLQTLGYIERAEATAADQPLYKVGPGGLRQALKQVPPSALDPMIWGTP